MFAATKAGGEATSRIDCCLTEVGDSVEPLLYSNRAQLTDAMLAAEKVKIVGGNALNLSSYMRSLTVCTNPNVICGVFSGTLNGVCQFKNGSVKVKIQGQPAVRLNDITTHNNGNCLGSVTTPSQTKVQILS